MEKSKVKSQKSKIIENCKLKIENSIRGFTLIELLIVMVIISILVGFLTVNFLTVRQRGRDAQRKSDLKQIQSALETYRSDYGYYPTAAIYSAINCDSSFTSVSGTTYMDKFPCDSRTGTPYIYTPIAADCTNASGSLCLSYTIQSCLENPSDNSPDTETVSQAICSSGKRYTVTNP